MINPIEIESVSEKKAEQLYDSVAVCRYCETPFKECDTLIPGKGLVVGEMDVAEYRNTFWHYGCVFDFLRPRKPGRKKKN